MRWTKKPECFGNHVSAWPVCEACNFKETCIPASRRKADGGRGGAFRVGDYGPNAAPVKPRRVIVTPPPLPPSKVKLGVFRDAFTGVAFGNFHYKKALQSCTLLELGDEWESLQDLDQVRNDVLDFRQEALKKEIELRCGTTGAWKNWEEFLEWVES